MKRYEREAYELELKRVASHLDLPDTGNVEQVIIDHFVQRLRDWLIAHGTPENLSVVATDFAASLDMGFTEISNQDDMDQLLLKMPNDQAGTIALLKTEFGENTDAVTIHRSTRKSWERPYLAIINCQDWHQSRRYFSKWHEIVHLLIEGQQLTFAFRHTKTNRPEPEEVLVDRIAAKLAFFPDIFHPVVSDEIQNHGYLTFETIRRVRERVAPDASLQATSLACLDAVTHPAWFLRCGMTLKAAEQRRLNDPQMSFIPDQPPVEKLRVLQGSPNHSATESGTTFYPNMRVPLSSIVARAFHSEFNPASIEKERLDDWETSSSGPLGSGIINVSAEWITDNEVWAIVQKSN